MSVNPEVIEIPNEASKEDDDVFPPDSEELNLTHSRTTAAVLNQIPFSTFTNLKRLLLRQNELDEFSILVPKEVEEIDLYDNKLTELPILGKEENEFLPNLTTVDFSFNEIRAIIDLSVKGLKQLYLVQNKIRSIENLENLTNLETLELGANRIRTIENLEHLTLLQELWLGKNKIAEIPTLNLPALRLLSLQSNRITEIKGLEKLDNLEEIYISHNLIDSIDASTFTNKKLRVIDLSENKLTSIAGAFKHLSDLEELWCSGNKLADIQEVIAELSELKELTTVYFEHNPLQEKNMATYRNKLKLGISSLKQIDATYTQVR